MNLKKNAKNNAEIIINVTGVKEVSALICSTKVPFAKAAFFVLFTVACRQKPGMPQPSPEARNAALLEQRLTTYNDSAYPQLAAKVQSGDLVVRLGADMTSEMLRQMNLSDKSFSHCGIASIEHDTIFVYHAIGGEFNPDQKVKRETLWSFGHPAENKALGAYRPQSDSLQKLAVCRQAVAGWQRGIMFDMQFDYTTNDRQYCAEYTAKCFEKGMPGVKFRHSKAGNIEYVAVDNLFMHPGMQMMVKARY